jgi:hypothetical protein
MKEEHIGYGLKNKIFCNSEVVYIDTALTSTGLIFASQAEYIQHLIDTNSALKLQNKKLLLKPHPETKRLYDLTILEKEGIKIIESEDFVYNLQNCCAVIVEPTTLALIPALMGIPLILPQYKKLQVLRFGEVLLTYPRALVLHDLNQLSYLLEKESQSVDTKSCKEWTDINSGPLPAEEMPNRVVKVILDLIKEKRNENINCYNFL